ncbi:ribose-phosphate pyrophosphokinase 3, chloroplastic-like [Hevea brasiliensis]|uniref:ribose-phosphate pyrophosphokinase 3, chloroplastic-like n=1 Tax=Hevea brasiliensis TaxID=3981 RepID=UPI0025EA0999|nr:ribose-phosphate pyrophosphokinase 3, chloroplastic-like [Hevea brasiliensis]
MRGERVAFLVSFSSPGVIYAFPRLFVASFTLVLPFFPTGSFEQMEEEGNVATAFTMIVVAFPDDGAQFPWWCALCTKVRKGDKRIVRLKKGNLADCHVAIVDDLVQSGGTLIEFQAQGMHLPTFGSQFRALLLSKP